MLVLDTHDTASPDSAELLVIIELVLELLAHGVKVWHVFLADISHSNACGSLEMTEFPEVGFSTEEAEGNALLPAEGGQEDDHLDWVDIMGDDNQLGLVLLNEGGHVVETILEMDRLGGLATLTFSFFLQAFFLVLLGFGAVFGEQFKELGS